MAAGAKARRTAVYHRLPVLDPAAVARLLCAGITVWEPFRRWLVIDTVAVAHDVTPYLAAVALDGILCSLGFLGTETVEVLPSRQVATALDRLERNDVRYQFVLDLADLAGRRQADPAYTPGGTPSSRRKCRVRWAWSWKPVATATSAARWPSSSSARARSSRRPVR